MRLEWEILELRTRHAFHIARMASPPARRSVWVRLRDGEGGEGWGEAGVSTPYYGETADTVTAVLPVLEQALQRSAAGDPFALERIERELGAAIGHNAAARSAVSAALHDLVGKRLGLPVWRLWGLDPSSAPRSSFTIGLDEPAAMADKAREARGYPILKIKVGTRDDERILAAVRDAAPDAVIRVDANTGWSPKQAIAALPMLAEFGVELVEQPVAPGDLEGLRMVRDRSPMPVIADESCISLADVGRLAGVVDGINIKLSKCGSLREAARMAHCARGLGLQVMLGCMVESTLGVAAAVQLAPLCDYLDLDGAALLAEDPFTGPGINGDGSVRFNELPGLGVERRPPPVA